ncbi:MAG: DUF4830 domain-containing protein [Clostridia bacterium]|nr:DUF4830 domain-containing protein [Clostridia bacterium]
MFKRYLFIFLWVIAAVALTAVCSAHGVKAETEADRQKLFKRYGWDVSVSPISVTEVKLPDAPDTVYEQYNKIQKKAGFDLAPYYGKTAVRYTYKVYNHKESENTEVYANILVCGGKMIGGDIMSTSLDGFMHAVNEREFQIK